MILPHLYLFSGVSPPALPVQFLPSPVWCAGLRRPERVILQGPVPTIFTPKSSRNRSNWELDVDCTDVASWTAQTWPALLPCPSRLSHHTGACWLTSSCESLIRVTPLCALDLGTLLARGFPSPRPGSPGNDPSVPWPHAHQPIPMPTLSQQVLPPHPTSL